MVHVAGCSGHNGIPPTTISFAMYLPSLLVFLHIAAAIVWIGGMAIMHFAVRPAVAQLEPPKRLPLMHAILARFFTMVSIAVPVLLISGIWLMSLMMGSGGRPPVSIHVMAGVGILMMAIYGHIRFALFPRLRRGVTAQDWASAAAALGGIRKLVAINLGLGTLTVAIALLGRALF
ncbi:CopD family protein [Uliginosibacterium sp. H1]|uniref:CopD family protein n=1 Tax=Uliginosibacterium sp. H1 TaxID=3114757 RepID=UPI002E193F52|nr:CopD family protein [Uliginosibacterium sp. H1]